MEPAAEERSGVFYAMPLVCFPHHITVLGRALSYMDPEGVCRLCGVAGAGWNQAGIRVSH